MTREQKKQLLMKWAWEGECPEELCCEHCGFPKIMEEEAHDMESRLRHFNQYSPIYVDICDCEEGLKDE